MTINIQIDTEHLEKLAYIGQKTHRDPNALHEAKLLSLDTNKAKRLLDWASRWDFAKTVSETVQWYREVHGEANANQVTLRQIEDFERTA